MNDSASLERGYRRLLACYPRGFRQENEEEILAVLLATAEEDRRRPGLAMSADLIRGGLLMRLRPTVPHSARTVRAAVKLMYLAAAAEAAVLLTVVLTAASVRAEVVKAAPAALHTAQFRIIADVVALPITMLLVLWLAWAIGRGLDPARLTLSAYFGLTTLDIVYSLSQGAAVIAPADLIASGVFWLLLLAAVILVFIPRSAPYYRGEPAQRQHA